jgi:hypothetical protein
LQAAALYERSKVAEAGGPTTGAARKIGKTMSIGAAMQEGDAFNWFKVLDEDNSGSLDLQEVQQLAS